ncbi:hypothetical protein POM88_027936 [Heracleum sosnowskyi]|uniref:RING-type domain-containing protein n=1 Tax=Heracleum sosnowskyi TaxID=360622 RepID=A0AAD8IAY4_9APIA|nr:hypothetical protein POM88_027936 [Heracleum sosnowskyi]
MTLRTQLRDVVFVEAKHWNWEQKDEHNETNSSTFTLVEEQAADFKNGDNEEYSDIATPTTSVQSRDFETLRNSNSSTASLEESAASNTNSDSSEDSGGGATPNQPLNNDQEGWMLPRPPSKNHPLGCLTIPGTTSNIHPAGRSTDSIPTRDIIRAERRGSIPTPRPIPITHPAGRTTSTPRPDMYPRRVPTRRRSAASSRAHVQNSDEPNIATREGSPVPGELQARGTISNCSICMNPFSDPTAAKCGHVFCRICINIAYELQGRCPMCRKSIDTRRDLLRIYLS